MRRQWRKPIRYVPYEATANDAVASIIFPSRSRRLSHIYTINYRFHTAEAEMHERLEHSFECEWRMVFLEAGWQQLPFIETAERKAMPVVGNNESKAVVYAAEWSVKYAGVF